MPLALPPSALCTLAELREFVGQAKGRDELLKGAILSATGAVESYLDRRIRFRAPAVVDGCADLVAAVALVESTATTLTLASTIASAGRAVKVKVICPASTITGGTVTVTGTVGGVAGSTEVFRVADAYEQDGLKFFTALSTITYTGMEGVATGDTIQVGSSLGYVEEHGEGYDVHHLRPLEWPVQNVLGVYEDATRAFAASSLLVVGTDYAVHRGGAEERGSLYRVADSTPYEWDFNWRSVWITYTGGYAAAAVPWVIKKVARHLAALIYQDSSTGTGGSRLGVISGSDPSGNWTRFAPSDLSENQRAELFPMRRMAMVESGSRDFSLEES